MVLIADQLHPDHFDVIFEFVLIELKVYLLLPILQLQFGLLYLFLYICYICLDFFIFLLKPNDGHCEFAFGFVLVFVGLDELIMVLFLSYPFLYVKSS